MFRYKKENMIVPVLAWMAEEDYYYDVAMVKQIENLALLPFIFHHIALNPDGHVGYGMPIGGVMATDGVIVPNAVGVDIGCGMGYVKTTLKEIAIEDLKKVMGIIRKNVPVGFGHHNENQTWEGFDRAPDIKIIQQELNSSRKQLGSLGGGNHFMEIQRDSDGFISLMLHSGSRNFGLKIAKTYHEIAQKLCDRWYSDIPDKELAFLPIETLEGKEYFDAMNFALEFAKQNRHNMIIAMETAVKDIIPEVEFGPVLDVHHNYACFENHYGQNVIVHRKGATSAREGQIGIIPGSQGTKSYIVKGKGNSESFNSCSHGAGRAMGRKEAQRSLNLEAEIKLLDDQGIIHSIRGVNDLDEASSAYKDINVVMGNQADLVDIVTELTPLAVIKG